MSMVHRVAPNRRVGPLVVSGGSGNDTIALQPQRLASGAGTTQMSSGVLFQRGQVTAATLSQCGLWRNGTEVACNLTALNGTYYDGSLVAALLQYQTPETITKSDTATGASPGSATYEFRFTGSSVGRVSQQASWIKDVPDGVWRLPPTHYKEPVYGMLSPLVPYTEVTGRWLTLDNIYRDCADYRWETLGETTTGTGTTTTPIESASGPSFYDQPRQRLQSWARGGPCKNLERGLLQAAVVRNYYDSGGWQQWHRQDTDCLPVAYWLTGVSTFRSVTKAMADGSLSIWMGPPSAPAYEDGRIIARNVGWAMHCWMLGYQTDGVTLPDGSTCTQWADGLVQVQLDHQSTSGSPPDGAGAWLELMEGGAVMEGYPGYLQSNFMAGIRVYYLDLYMVYRGPSQVAGVADAILDNAVFGRTQWDATYDTYHYWSDWALGDPGVPLSDMRNLALMCLSSEMLAYRHSGGTTPTDHVADMLDMHNTEAAFGGPGGIPMWSSPSWSMKIYTETHHMYPYIMARSNTVGVL